MTHTEGTGTTWLLPLGVGVCSGITGIQAGFFDCFPAPLLIKHLGFSQGWASIAACAIPLVPVSAFFWWLGTHLRRRHREPTAPLVNYRRRATLRSWRKRYELLEEQLWGAATILENEKLPSQKALAYHQEFLEGVQRRARMRGGQLTQAATVLDEHGHSKPVNNPKWLILSQFYIDAADRIDEAIQVLAGTQSSLAKLAQLTPKEEASEAENALAASAARLTALADKVKEARKTMRKVLDS